MADSDVKYAEYLASLPLDTPQAGDRAALARDGAALGYEPSEPGPGGGSGDVATDDIWDAKGDLAVGTGADTAARLPVGSNDQVLVADSSESTGLKWSTPAGGGNVSATGGPASGEFARWASGTTIEGRTAEQVRGDLGLGDSATRNVGTGSTDVAAGDAPAAAASAAESAANGYTDSEVGTLAAALGTAAFEPTSAFDPSGAAAAAQAHAVQRANHTGTQAQSTITNLETDLAGKVDKAPGINAQTGTSYTLALSDAHKLVTLDNGSAVTVTVPPQSSVAWPAETRIKLARLGAGGVTVAEGSGVDVHVPAALSRVLEDRYSAAELYRLAEDEWLLVGRLAESS